MRRIYLVFVTLVWTLASLSTESFAADQFTYRAGQAYMKTSASSFSECEAQCRGDAACRGWNFIQPNPRSRSGICEFNARKAAPISSPISMSGEINTRVDMLLSRAIPTASGNTVRVGTPIAPKRTVKQAVKQAVAKRPILAPQMIAMPANTPKRIIKRLPVDNIVKAPIPAGYRPISAAKLQPFTGPVQPRSMTRQQIYHEQMLAAQKRAEAQAKFKMQQQAQYRAGAISRPPQHFIPKSSQAPMIPIAPPNQQSLYGSLYDDLTQNMTPVPRPQTAPNQFNNPDAPLATNLAIPAVPVQIVPLSYPAIPRQQIQGPQNLGPQNLGQQFPGLAGG